MVVQETVLTITLPAVGAGSQNFFIPAEERNLLFA
jgi:hypothetical protein